MPACVPVCGEFWWKGEALVRCRTVRAVLIGLLAIIVSVFAVDAWEIRPPSQTRTSQVLVTLAPGVDAAAEAARLQARGLRATTHAARPDWLTVTAPTGYSAEGLADELRALPSVSGADPHLRCYALYSPNDPYYRPYDDPDPYDGGHQYYLFDMNAAPAWDIETGSSNTVIAVIDSGLSFYHEDIDGLVWTNTGEIAGDGIDNDGNGYVDDVHGWDFAGDNIGDPATDTVDSSDSNPNVWDPAWWDDSWGEPPHELFWWEDSTWAERLATLDPAIGNTADDNGDSVPDTGVNHGTNVAALTTALTDNSIGMAGMSWGCSIMPLRVINAEGWGWGVDAADAIRYAADNGADIINMSFSFGLVDFDNPPAPGDPGYADYLEALEVRDAVVYAAGKGAIIVASAGNSGDTYQGVDFPADMPETISVGSIGPTGDRSSFSAYALPDQVLDVVAPGEEILTAGVLDMYSWAAFWSLGMDWPLGEDTYTMVQGTSFSAPLISGLAGLYRSAYPTLTMDDFREALHAVSIDLGPVGYDEYYGYGIPDAHAVLEYGGGQVPEPVTTGLFLVGLGALAWRVRRRGREDDE